jgi:hypothetical protein
MLDEHGTGRAFCAIDRISAVGGLAGVRRLRAWALHEAGWTRQKIKISDRYPSHR